MANICEYKVIVKGKKNACYAFFGSMPWMDYKDIVEEKEDNGVWTVKFEGDCKWSVDCYCLDPWKGDTPVVLPEDPDEALSEAADKYYRQTVQERSEMFNVEVWCNSADIEDEDTRQVFEHYINGESVRVKRPAELRINY